MNKLFGTDGMRGDAGVFPLDENSINIVGSSLARQFQENLGREARFVLGRDTRESGEWIEKAFCKGAISAGAHCESAGIITTPGVAFLTKNGNFDAGIVISASHNPFNDNGIKIFSPNGRKIDETTEREIEKDVYNNLKFKNENPAIKVPVHRVAEMQGQYLKYLQEEFATLLLDNLKMVIDCANGAASVLAPKLFESFGGEVSSFFCEPNGRNINRNCGSLHLDNLQKKVLEEKADFGVAFDGDADRSLFVDEKGNLVDGDAVLWIMAKYLQAKNQLNNQTVVATVMSNIGLEIALNSKNIRLLRTGVGDKYVLQELINTKSSIGGEQSGHIIFPNKSLVGDGMMTTLYLLEAMRENGLTLSELTEGFLKFPQILVNVKVKDKLPFDEVAEIADAAARIEDELGEKGRLLLRYSGTENLARVMIEGENQTEIEAQANSLAEVIIKKLG